MAIMAAIGAGLGLLQGALSLGQQKAQREFDARMKQINDTATKTSFGNAVARARAAKYDTRDEARVAYADIIKRRMQNMGRAKVQAAVTGIAGTSVTDTLLSIKRGEQEAFLSVEQGVEANIKSIDNQMQKNLEGVYASLRSGETLDLSSDFGDALNLTTSAMYGYSQFGGSFAPTPRVSQPTTSAINPINTPWGGR